MGDPQFYSPETLAERWACSPRHVRRMCSTGALPAFRVGAKLFRIRHSDVEQYECQIGTSPALTDNTASPGTSQMDAVDVTDLRPQPKPKPTRLQRLDLQNLRHRRAGG